MGFFEENKQEVETPTPTEEIAPSNKIKVGEEEFSDEELSRLVGLGKYASELETKWNTKVDRLMPEYTRVTQDKKALEEELSKYKSAPEQTDEETLRQEALKEAKSLGLVTKDDFDVYYQQRRAGERILDDTNSFVDSIKTEGKPAVEAIDLLEYMAANGIKEPSIAYKVMKDKELDAWKESKLKEIKPETIQTDTSSAASTKSPEEVMVDRFNLRNQIREAINK